MRALTKKKKIHSAFPPCSQVHRQHVCLIERLVTLRTLALSRVNAGLYTLHAKHMTAASDGAVASADIANFTSQQ